jgi:hypothetical protein
MNFKGGPPFLSRYFKGDIRHIIPGRKWGSEFVAESSFSEDDGLLPPSG